jgi:hypothetical protein
VLDVRWLSHLVCLLTCDNACLHVGRELFAEALLHLLQLGLYCVAITGSDRRLLLITVQLG